MSGLRDLFAVPPIPEQEETVSTAVYYEKKFNRANELYSRELKKGVELGRNLGAFEARFGKLRTHITDVVNRAVVAGGMDPMDAAVIAFRNTVRIMKGKNKL